MYICSGYSTALDTKMEFEIAEKKNTALQQYELLFRQYYEPLVRYGVTLLKNQEDAEDIVQQVFVNYWEKFTSIAVHTSERAMLYKAVHNACLNKIKYLKVRSLYAKNNIVDTYESEDALELLKAKELNDKISQVLDELPEQCVKVFKMSRFEQLKYQEIAEKLDLSLKTVENHMGRALKLIREHLKEYITVFVLLLIGQ